MDNKKYLTGPANLIQPITPASHTGWSVRTGLERHLRKKPYKIGSALEGKVGGLTSAESKQVGPAPLQGDSPFSPGVKLTTCASTLLFLDQGVQLGGCSGAISLHFQGV